MNTPTAPHALPARQRGFTFLELLVVLAITVILVGIAVPSMASVVNSVKVSSTANMFLASLRLARSESLKRGGRVALCKSPDGVACVAGGGWDQGWVTFHDANANGELDASEKIIERVQPLSQGIKFTGNQNVARYISFVSGGIMRGASGGLQPGTLTLCHVSLARSEARQIVMSSGGRPRVSKTSVPSCG